MRKLLWIAALFAAVAFFTGCGGDEDNTFTVTFDLGEHDSKSHGTIPSQKIKDGQFAARPNDPVSQLGEKFEFIDWFDDEEDPFEFGLTSISKNITLYASWNELDDGALLSIAVTGNPKLVYDIGDNFDDSGLVITAAYVGAKENVDVTSSAELTFMDGTPLNNSRTFAADDIGPHNIAVTYEEDGITRTTSFVITVNRAAEDGDLESIHVEEFPTTLIYEVYETFDPAGLYVEARYIGDRPPEDVTIVATLRIGNKILSDTYQFVAADIGNNIPVTVTYSEGDITRETSFSITVNPAPKASLAGGNVTGVTQIELDPVVLTITLPGALHFVTGGNEIWDTAEGWITNLPAGLEQTITRNNNAEVEIEITGTPTEESDELILIIIPREFIIDFNEDMPVTNTEYYFDIQ
ncbi:MAG: InlB B-repeat-containing protein [Treponema sp.]|jgi:hypothetical protein|nr:InlB B-repeat-containing protein [Treponema sp.]